MACVIDLSMLLAESSGAPLALVNTVTGLVLLIFTVDLSVRAFVYRRMLLKSPWAYFDITVVGASLILYLIGIAAEANEHVTSSRGVSASLRGLIVVLRWFRAARALAVMVKTSGTGTTAARQLTGQNKRRFVDLEAGFDLDLAYVRPKLIAMSVPSTGITSLYRNPLSEVVRFLDSRHSNEGYLVVNACPELPYPHDRFRSGSVVAYDVQDHTPPTMAQFVEFLNTAAAAAQRGRLLAIHCRGGKGRTGCLCCAWMLYARDAADADDALALFALGRTELGLGRKKLQGVDTPSQQRYVHQLSALLRAQSAYLVPEGSGAESPATHRLAADTGGGAESVTAASCVRPVMVELPARPTLAVRELELSHWFAKPPRGALVCAVHTEAPPRAGACYVVRWSAPVLRHGMPTTTVLPLGDAHVTGDVRVSVFDLDALLEARRERVKRGLDPRLTFDRAPSGPWGAGGAMEPANGTEPPLRTTSEQQHEPAKWTQAGKEPGCLFYFLFHTAFVGADQQLHVPLTMMDHACKNSSGKYLPAGEATLRFSTLANGSAV